MALLPGTRLGPYEVIAPIGVGGMGEVYRATDTKLKRQVAIKVLPASVAGDAERLARFQREAEMLASLNHPNIAAIYGLEESDGLKALVMELVEGPTLADRIAQGAIPLDDVLPIARQIAEALEAAHEHGIIHRDLKPANVKVRPDGTVKVLDFGLAKAMEGADAAGRGSGNHLTQSPTITTPAMTQAGIILGTAAYMAPEQARGKTVDKRADIWAFGVVIFEMLTGRRAFTGDDISITLASVMMKEPEWSALPETTPWALRQLLTRCLKKDPKARMRDIGEARLQLEDLLTGATDAASTHIVSSARSRWQRVLPWASTGVLALGLTLAAAAVIALRRAGDVVPAAGPLEFTIAPPESTSFGSPRSLGSGLATQVAVSPDGQNIVFVAGASAGYQIWVRPIATLTARPIPGTEGGIFPFWSPDSRSIGFFAAGKLKKVQIAGGPPIVLCDAPYGRGGSWSRDNVILFAPSTNGALLRVSSAGGVPADATTLNPATGETNHRWPSFLPDGRHFLYTATTGACCPPSKPSVIRIGSLGRTDATVTLFEGAESSVSYASGHLLFANIDDILMAQPFDLDARELKGAPFPLAEHVSHEGSRYTAVSASENGTLVYAHGDSQARQLTWFDRAGGALSALGDSVPYTSGSSLALSPDGQRVAVAQATGRPANVDIWIIDLARNGPSRRLTFEPGGDGSPVWSPDSTRIAFSSQRSGKISLHQRTVNGTATDELLLEGPGNIAPNDWSADGRYIAFEDRTSANIDLWVLPLFGDRQPFPLVRTEFNEATAVFAPDVHWIAYSSNDGGQSNVYVQPFPGTGGKIQISRDGGSQPVWRADGKELFFLGADGTLMAVPIDAIGQFSAGVPQALFVTAVPIFNSSRGQYAVTKDGKRFLTTASPQQPSVTPLTVVVNWTTTIRK